MTINEAEFQQLCQAAAAHVARNTANEHSARYAALVTVVFPRLCAFLGLDPDQQQRALGVDCGFQLLQTLEEHMQPAFDGPAVLKAYL